MSARHDKTSVITTTDSLTTRKLTHISHIAYPTLRILHIEECEGGGGGTRRYFGTFTSLNAAKNQCRINPRKSRENLLSLKLGVLVSLIHHFFNKSYEDVSSFNVLAYTKFRDALT